MLSKILKSNQPFVIALIFIFGVSFWVYSFIDPLGIAIPTDSMNMPFYEFIENYIPHSSFFGIFAAFLLVLLQAFLLVQFNKKHIIINYRTYLPAFFYIVISSSFIQLHRLNPALIGAIFIFAAINSVFSTYRSDYALNKLYIAGFLVAVASLFWGPLAIFILIIGISLSILRTFIGREWIVGILGFLTPYLFVFVYFFVFLKEEKLTRLLGYFISSFEFIKPFYSLHYSYYIFYGFLGFLVIVASYVIIINFQKKKIKARKYFEINLWFFLISLGILVILRNVTYEIIYIISIPISFLLSDYFYY